MRVGTFQCNGGNLEPSQGGGGQGLGKCLLGCHQVAEAQSGIVAIPWGGPN